MLAEIEDVLRHKAPDLLGQMALLLATCGVEHVPSPPPELVAQIAPLVAHPGDAKIIVAALANNSDYFVTHDAGHFLDNRALRARVTFPIGDPGDFLRWYRGLLDMSL